MSDIKVVYSDPLWEKYGLCHSRIPLDTWWGVGAKEDMDRYYDLVSYCHTQVAFYWEKFPEERTRGYFEICDIVCKEQADEAAALITKHSIRNAEWNKMCEEKARHI